MLPLRKEALSILEREVSVEDRYLELVEKYELEKKQANCKCKHNSIKNKYRKLIEIELRKTL